MTRGEESVRAPRRHEEGRGRPRFFYDLASPYAYLAAERIDGVFPVAPEWVPVFAAAIFKATGRVPWPLTAERETRMREVEERVRERGLRPVRWPPIPANSLPALRAAVYADGLGLGKRFALEAFRAQFVEGRTLSSEENLVLVAKRAGLDPDATLAATTDAAVKERLRANTDAALDLGVGGVPTVWVAGDVFWGDDRLEEAAAAAQTSIDAELAT